MDRLVAHDIGSYGRTGLAPWLGPYSAHVLAMTLDTAKTIAVVGATVLAIAAVASFWIMKSIVQKLAVAALLGLLAFAVWTQRVAVQDCADKVTASFERSGANLSVADTECSFFGITVTISDPRADDASSGRS